MTRHDRTTFLGLANNLVLEMDIIVFLQCIGEHSFHDRVVLQYNINKLFALLSFPLTSMGSILLWRLRNTRASNDDNISSEDIGFNACLHGGWWWCCALIDLPVVSTKTTSAGLGNVGKEFVYFNGQKMQDSWNKNNQTTTTRTLVSRIFFS